MTFYREADIDRMLNRFGIDVTLNEVGGATVKGLIDIADESLLADEGASYFGKTHTITVRTGALGPGLAEGASVTADGVTYQVMRTQQIDDGALTRIIAARS